MRLVWNRHPLYRYLFEGFEFVFQDLFGKLFK